MAMSKSVQRCGEAILAEERKKRIVKDYTDCTGLLNKFFGLLWYDVCGPCVSSDPGKRGCCVGGGALTANMKGPVYDYILELRKEKTGIATDEEKTPCSYHSKATGCLIPDLKGPCCAAFYCIDKTAERRYGIEYDVEMIGRVLTNILSDTREVNGRKLPGADQNEIDDFKKYMDQMIFTVKAAKASISGRLFRPGSRNSLRDSTSR